MSAAGRTGWWNGEHSSTIAKFRLPPETLYHGPTRHLRLTLPLASQSQLHLVQRLWTAPQAALPSPLGQGTAGRVRNSGELLRPPLLPHHREQVTTSFRPPAALYLV